MHIYEADYSAMTVIICRSLIKSSEKHKTTNKGQIGGRAGHDTNTLMFLKEIKNDITRRSKKLLVNINSNVTLCYDRIIPNLANLIKKKKGLHQNVTFVHAKTLEEAKFKLKTALGVSKSFYTHSQVFPIYSTGKDSTNSPTI